MSQIPQQHTDSDVISFLTNLITLGDVNSIDDSPDKIIRVTDTGEPLMQKVGDAYLPCALYGTRATNVCVINPFTMGMAGEYSWFSRSRVNIFGYCIVGVMRNIIKAAIESKETPTAPKTRGRPSKKKIEMTAEEIDTTCDDSKKSHEFWELAAPFVNDCNEKLIKELNSISSKMDDFFNVHYDKTRKISSFKCLLFNEKQKKAFPSVRAGSWITLTSMLKSILKISGNDLSEFDYAHNFQGADTFEGLCAILIELYDRATPAIAVVYPDVDISSKIHALKSHMKYFGQYNSTASWCRNTVPTPATMVSNQPHAMPYSPPTGYVQPGAYASQDVSGVPVRRLTPTPHIPYAPIGGDSYHHPHGGNVQSFANVPIMHTTNDIPIARISHPVPITNMHQHQYTSAVSPEDELVNRTNPFVDANRRR